MTSTPIPTPNTTATAPEVDLTNKATQPSGVIRRNLKMQVYLGIAVLFIIATMLSSLRHKTAGNKADPNKPPAPMVQDASTTNVEEVRREIGKQQQEAAHPTSATDPSLATAAQMALPGQMASMPYANGMPANYPCAPGQPCATWAQYASQQSGQLTPRQQQVLAFDTQEKELAYKARFASNLAFSQSHGIRGPSSLAYADSGTASPNAATAANPQAIAASQYAPATSMIAPREAGQELSKDQPSADKRAAEVNINSAVGQPYVVYEGTFIDTVLMNRLDGDAVGPVKVMVTNPIYSHDHQHVLVPEGTVVLGDARKVGSAGFGQQRRIAVVFHRMIMPDGYSVDLDQFQGLNQIGETGLKDKVNNHYLRIFGASIALGLIGGAAEMSNNGGAITGNGIDAYKYGVAASMSENATTVLDRFINTPPTITIREGHRVKVYITQDLLLPAIENHTISQTY
jgi:type IV secretion system protein VirB10